MSKRSRSSRVSNPITCWSVTHWASTPHGMPCPQAKKTSGTFRPLERGLQSAALKSGKQTRFIQADAATFQPTQSFDAVVFNESLYYLHATPLCVLEQYIPAIKPNGYLMISLFMETKRNQKIDKQLKNCPWLQLVYEITATTVNKQGRILTWRCSVWRPNRQTEKCAA